MDQLERAEWQRRAAAHRDRLAPVVEAHLERRRLGVKHPVWDFLFRYYSQKPAQALRWHPGYRVSLVDGAAAYGALKGYVVTGTAAGVSASHVASQRPLVEALLRLLSATASRPAHLGCFGLHEWAMVYGQSPAETRHTDWPLRLGGAGTDEVVESHRIACSHFDAFRFFTEPARTLNTLSPGPDDRVAFEQPGCLHAGMDLYKHAYRLTPMIASDLVADCFELARDIRVLDMRAAPYDLADLGLEPVRIETADGKRDYAVAQAEFAERGAPLRARLIEECARLLGASPVCAASPVASPVASAVASAAASAAAASASEVGVA